MLMVVKVCQKHLKDTPLAPPLLPQKLGHTTVLIGRDLANLGVRLTGNCHAHIVLVCLKQQNIM